MLKERKRGKPEQIVGAFQAGEAILAPGTISVEIVQTLEGAPNQDGFGGGVCSVGCNLLKLNDFVSLKWTTTGYKKCLRVRAGRMDLRGAVEGNARTRLDDVNR